MHRSLNSSTRVISCYDFLVFVLSNRHFVFVNFYRNTVEYDIRVIQEMLPLSILRQLYLAPVTCPASLDLHFGRKGRLHVEMRVDRSVVYYGEKLALHVAITNFSNKTIRKIMCELIQVLLLPFVGERRTPFSWLENTEYCPIPPGTSRYLVIIINHVN